VGLVHALATDPACASASTALFGPLPDTAALPRAGKPTTRTSERDQAHAWAARSNDTQRAVSRVLARLTRSKAAASDTPATSERDAAFQLVALTNDDVHELVAFLDTLTDAPPPRALVTPPP